MSVRSPLYANIKNKLSCLLQTKLFYLSFLVLVFAVLAVINFPYGTWFTGWDNLHPEFNFGLNIKRALFAVWQEKGVGFMGGHGYAATLPHTVFIWFLSVFVPPQYLRVVFTLLMLLVGSLGAFCLTARILQEKAANLKHTASLFTGLFYMLNIGTVQNFYIPLEAFTVHFAFLPWLLLSLFSLLQQFSRRNIVIFALINFLAIPQGFIPPLLIVYMLFLVIFLAVYLWPRSKTEAIHSIKRLALIISLVLATNAFWLLPVIYYTVTNSGVYLEAYNNLHSTEDFILKNQKYGGIEDLALLRGFIFEAIDVSAAGQTFNILGSWVEHFRQWQIQAIGYLYFVLILVGAGYAILKRREKIYWALFVSFLLAFTFLATDVVPFSFISHLLRNYVSVFKQAFRVSFTKFSISLALFYATFFGLGIYWLLEKLQRWRGLKIVSLSVLSLSLFVYALPAFRGDFFYGRLRVNIPEGYFKLFEFFEKEGREGRIANLPQGWNWGWSVYRWGYSGSGFLWYGIEQPILDRAFDVWSRQSENYYWELSNALYAEDFVRAEAVLDKYGVEWIIFDENIIAYPNAISFKYADKLKEHLASSGKFDLEAIFADLQVYKVNLEREAKEFVYITGGLPRIEAKYQWNNFDRAYLEFGDYFTRTSVGPRDAAEGFVGQSIFYPFRSLFTRRGDQDLEFEVEDRGEYFVFRSKIPSQLSGGNFILPALSEREISQIDYEDYSRKIRKLPRVLLDGREIPADKTKTMIRNISASIVEVIVPKVGGLYSYDSRLDESFSNHTANPCGVSKMGEFSQKIIFESEIEIVKFASKDSPNCYDIILAQLTHSLGYGVTIVSRNVAGKPLQFTVVNHNSHKGDLEATLPQEDGFRRSFYIISPMKGDGLGYSLHFNNISLDEEESVNDLALVAVNPLPYRFLTEMKVILKTENPARPAMPDGRRAGAQKSKTQINNTKIEVEHPNQSLYRVSLKGESIKTLKQAGVEQIGYNTLVLSQAYDRGWRAYQVKSQKPASPAGRSKVKSWLSKALPFLFGSEVGEHVLVNNWENGWQLNSSRLESRGKLGIPIKASGAQGSRESEIVIVYWPQYLQYLGFGLLLVVPLIVLKYSRERV